MSRDFPVKGLKELDAFLSALPKNMHRNAISQGLRAAAAVVREEAKMRAPKDTGKLALSIKSGSVDRSKDGHLSIKVSAKQKKGGHGYLAWFIEYGVRPHLITVDEADYPVRNTRHGPRKVSIKKVNEMVHSGSLKIGENFVGDVVHHPGIRPHPFLRPALDVKAEDAVRAFAAKIRDYIEGKTGFSVPVDEDL